MSMLQGRVLFDPEDPMYETHFPGRPVVPGSVIVSTMRTILSEHDVEMPTIRRARFIRFCMPSEYRFEINMDDASAAWRILNENGILAEGEFCR